jgi:hypothetical protein
MIGIIRTAWLIISGILASLITRNGLFFDQSEDFLRILKALAREADDAMRC